MNYRLIIYLLFSFFLLSCDQSLSKKTKKIELKIENRYKNSGFALIYDENLLKIKKLEKRSLNIYHKSLKKRSKVKITNPNNGKFLIAEVKSNRVKFSNFYNSILSQRIAEELEIDFNEPFVEIILVSKDSTFIAKKTKMFEEERSVAEKAPVDTITIDNLGKSEKDKKVIKKKNFLYSIKIADFYYKDSAENMILRIKKETNLKNPLIKKLSQTKYRVLLGPFNDIKKLEKSFDEIKLLEFENLEILKDA